MTPEQSSVAGDFFERAAAQEKRLAEVGPMVDSLENLTGIEFVEMNRKISELMLEIDREDKALKARVANARAAVSGLAAPAVPYAKALRGRLTRQIGRHGKSKRRRG